MNGSRFLEKLRPQHETLHLLGVALDLVGLTAFGVFFFQRLLRVLAKALAAGPMVWSGATLGFDGFYRLMSASGR